ncbi:MAG: MotE family protein [Desulfovibrionaceae bacterium]
MRIVTIVRGLFVLGLVKAFFILFMFSNHIMEKAPLFLSKTQVKKQITFLEIAPVQATTLPTVAENKTETNSRQERESENAMQKKIMVREKELDKKEKELQNLEANINKKLQELQNIQKQLDNTLKDIETAKNKNLLHLIDVYSNMKSQQAAVVLENLDEKIAIQILSGMKGRKAGEILSFVETNKAAKLSEQLTKLQIPFK